MKLVIIFIFGVVMGAFFQLYTGSYALMLGIGALATFLTVKFVEKRKRGEIPKRRTFDPEDDSMWN